MSHKECNRRWFKKKKKKKRQKRICVKMQTRSKHSLAKLCYRHTHTHKIKNKKNNIRCVENLYPFLFKLIIYITNNSSHQSGVKFFSQISFYVYKLSFTYLAKMHFLFLHFASIPILVLTFCFYHIQSLFRKTPSILVPTISALTKIS